MKRLKQMLKPPLALGWGLGCREVREAPGLVRKCFQETSGKQPTGPRLRG